MSKTIWKYELEAESLANFQMPIGAEILTVQVQNEKPCMWALVDEDKETEQRCFEIIGTGHTMYRGEDLKRNYIGTFQLHGGSLVFHLFEYQV
jgi:hypothetical protein